MTLIKRDGFWFYRFDTADGFIVEGVLPGKMSKRDATRAVNREIANRQGVTK